MLDQLLSQKKKAFTYLYFYVALTLSNSLCVDFMVILSSFEARSLLDVTIMDAFLYVCPSKFLIPTNVSLGNAVTIISMFKQHQCCSLLNTATFAEYDPLYLLLVSLRIIIYFKYFRDILNGNICNIHQSNQCMIFFIYE